MDWFLTPCFNMKGVYMFEYGLALREENNLEL